MRILLDNGVASRAASRPRCVIMLRGWDALRNGELLAAAEGAAFDLFVTTDKNIEHPASAKLGGPSDRDPHSWKRPTDDDQASP